VGQNHRHAGEIRGHVVEQHQCSAWGRPVIRPATSGPERPKDSGTPTSLIWSRYIPRYFLGLADVAGRCDPAVARVLVQHGFPHPAVATATLWADEECLASTLFPASVRRLLADQLDDLRRALQIRSGAA
jgi:hypothetical protein